MGYIHPLYKAFLRLICLLSKKFILCDCLISVHRYKIHLKENIFLKITIIGEHHACFLSLSYYHYAT